MRRAGSAALDLAWLAVGRVDGFWEFGLSPWDVAAGGFLIEEAGGQVTDPEGGAAWLARGDIVASNRRIHGTLLRTIRAARGGG